jgi:inorganic pyrophosphatase
MKPLSFDHIPPFYTEDENEPNGINLVVETPRGGRHKFALVEEYGVMELRRTVPAGFIWPCDFGFVPQTLGEDGDALDVAMLIEEPCFPGCLVRARVLGVIGMKKNGEQNDRILACPVSLPGAGSIWDDVRTIHDVSARVLRELETFLEAYQTFEGNEIEMTGISEEGDAMQVVRSAHVTWKEAQNNSKLRR